MEMTKEEYWASVFARKAFEEGAETTLEELAWDYLAGSKARAISLDAYRKNLEAFLAWASARRIANPCKNDIDSYRDDLVRQGKKPRTVNGYIGQVKSLFKWGARNNRCLDVGWKVKLVPVPEYWRGEKDPLPLAKVRRLLSKAKKDMSKVGLRDYALLSVLFCTGIRSIEAVRADVKDIRERNGEMVLWVQGKGHDDKDAYVPLGEDCLKVVMEYLSARKASPEEPLFTSNSNRNSGCRLTTAAIQKIVKRTFREIGLDSPRYTTHSTRYTAINLVVDKCGGERCSTAWESARKLARHANIESTGYYYNWKRGPWTELEILEARSKCACSVADMIFGPQLTPKKEELPQ